MKLTVLDVLNKDDVVIALIGATNDSKKYGNIIYKDLKKKNIKVYGVNPKATTIEGDKAYPSIESLPERPDILNFVVPPKIAYTMIRDAVEKGYDNFWLQPGAESEEIMDYLDSKGKTYLANACVMVETR